MSVPFKTKRLNKTCQQCGPLCEQNFKQNHGVKLAGTTVNNTIDLR